MGCSCSHPKVNNANESSVPKKKLTRRQTTVIESNSDNLPSKNEAETPKQNQNGPDCISNPKNNDNNNGGNIANTNKNNNNQPKRKVDDEFIIQNGSEEEEIPSLTLDSDSDDKSESKGSTISEISDSSYSSYDENDDHGLVISKVAGYKFVRKLGKGAFSTVIEMKKDSKSYAIKICDMSKEKYKFFKYSSQTDAKNNANNKKPNASQLGPKEEVAIMKRFSHPYIIKFYDFYEDEKAKKMYIVMELLSGGNISRCGTLQQKKIAFAQSVSGLQYIHFQRIAHRDIKVDNILRAEDGSIRIADFGVSKLVPEGTNKISIEMIGTPAYSAPEIFGDSMYDPFAADVWSLGVTLYYMLFDRLPFVADKLSEIQRKVSVEDVRFPDGTDKSIMDLIRKMLKKNPTKRIKLNDIWDHPWMAGLKEKVIKPTFSIKNSSSQIYKGITPSQRKNSISYITNKGGKPSLNCI